MSDPSLLALLAEGADLATLTALVEAAERRGDPSASAMRRDLEPARRVLESVGRLRAREADLAALYATANDLTAIRDVQEILAAIVSRVRQMLGTDISYLGLNVPEDDAAYIQVTDGAVSASFRNLKLPLGTGLLGLVAETGVPYWTADYETDERFSHRRYIDSAVSDERIRAILGVPMRVKGTVIGALLAANRTPRPFSTSEVELLSSFAAHAAIALENARLFSASQESLEALAQRTREAEEAARVHDALTQALVADDASSAVARVLADHLRADVTVFASDGTVLGAAGEALPWTADLRARVQESLASGHAAPPGGDRAPYVVASSARGALLGAVALRAAEPLTAAQARTLERGALGIAVLELFETIARASERTALEDLLGDLVAGRGDARRVREWLRASGTEADGRWVVVVADGDPALGRAAFGPVETWVRRRGGLALVRAGEVVALVPVPAGEAAATAELLHRQLGLVHAATTSGAVETALDGVAGAYEDARRCRDAMIALGRRGEVATPATLGAVRLVLARTESEEVRAFTDELAGPVLAWDADRGTALAATIEAWADAGGSPREAARVLHVHANTVVQRLERVDALLGPGWRDPQRLLDLRLALRLARIAGRAGGDGP